MLTVCLDCSEGSFGSALALTACALCEAGKFTLSARQVSCADCAAGFYAANNGLRLAVAVKSPDLRLFLAPFLARYALIRLSAIR
jgi:hypothetical protein